MGRNTNPPLDEEEFLLNHWIMYFDSSGDEQNSESCARFLLNRYFIFRNVSEKIY